MSKHWKPTKTTVALNPAAAPSSVRPSRIRREPVRINANVPEKPRRPVYYRERELFFGILGIAIFGAAIAAAVIALSFFTVFHDDPAADAQALQFSQCYNAQGPNCVLDGGTVFVNGQRIQIAGVEAPAILEAKCDREHDRGVEAATELMLILNSGPVSVGPAMRDASGRLVHKVAINGRDIAQKMIDQDVAHQSGSGLSWCH